MAKIKIILIMCLCMMWSVYASAGPMVIPSSSGGTDNATINSLIDQDHADNATTLAGTSDNESVTPAGLAYFKTAVKLLTSSSALTSGYVAYSDGSFSLSGDSGFTWDGNILTVNGSIFLGGRTYLVAHVNNVLSIRNGSNPGGYHWYYNYVSASDYDYGYVSIDSDNVTIGQDSNGTSQDNKDLVLKPGGTGVIKNPGGSFQINPSGAVTASSYSTTRGKTTGAGYAIYAQCETDNCTAITGYTPSNDLGLISMHIDTPLQADNNTVVPATIFKRYHHTAEAGELPESGIGLEHQIIIHNDSKDNEFIAARLKYYLRNVTTDNETTVTELVNVSQGAEVTALKLDGPNLIAGGTISGKIPMITKTDNYTLGTDSSQEAYGYMVWISGANKIVTLPAVVPGMSVCVYSTDATAKVIDPNANDGIRNGTATRNADGHKITSGGTAGDFACLIADSADGWTVMGKSGTWTDE